MPPAQTPVPGSPPPLPPPLPVAHADSSPPPSLARAAFADLVVAAAMMLIANFVLVAAVVVVHLVGRSMKGERLGPGVGDSITAGLMPEIIVAGVFATLVAAVLTWLIRARRTPALPALRNAVAYPLAIVAGFAIQGACIGISMLAALSGRPIVPSNSAPLEQLGQQAPWVMWAIAVVIAPVAEELLFRHVLVRRFALAGRATLGILLTSLFFAALHEPVPGDAGVVAWLSAVAMYVAMGAGFGLVYVRTGRLGAAIAAHAACNLMAVGIAAFSMS